MITDKTKEHFEEWLLIQNRNIKNYTDAEFLEYFYISDIRIQYKYCLDFFDKHFKYWIAPFYNHDVGVMNKWAGFNDKGIFTIQCDTKDETVVECIKELNKKYNENLTVTIT